MGTHRGPPASPPLTREQAGMACPQLPLQRPGPTARHPPQRRRSRPPGSPAAWGSSPGGQRCPRTALPAFPESARAQRPPSRSPPRSARPWPRFQRRGRLSPAPLPTGWKAKAPGRQVPLVRGCAPAPMCSRGAGRLLPPRTRPAAAQGGRGLAAAARCACAERPARRADRGRSLLSGTGARQRRDPVTVRGPAEFLSEGTR